MTPPATMTRHRSMRRPRVWLRCCLPEAMNGPVLQLLRIPSTSYPRCRSLRTKLSLAGIEFPIRELELQKQKQQTIFTFLVSVLVCILALLAIAMAAVNGEDRKELVEIGEDTLPLPDVKLTRREMEIARLSAQGMLKRR